MAWLASLTSPENTEAFLGMRGYIWDMQTDMFWSLIVGETDWKATEPVPRSELPMESRKSVFSKLQQETE